MQTIESEQLKRVFELSRQLLSSFYLVDPKTVWESVVKHLSDLFDCELVSLFLVDENDASQLVLESQHPPRPDRLGKLRVPIESRLGGGLTSHVAASGETISLSKSQIDSNVYVKDHKPTYLQSGLCYSVLYVPLKNRKGRLLGLLRLNNRSITQTDRHVAFSNSDTLAMHLLATHIVSLLENTKASDMLRRLTLDIQRAKSTSQAVNRILNHSMRLLQADSARLALWSREKKGLVTAGTTVRGHATNQADKDSVDVLVPEHDPIVGVFQSCVASGEPMDPGDASELWFDAGPYDGTFFWWHPAALSTVSVILRVHQQPIGVLQLESFVENGFDDLDCHLLKAISQNVAVAVPSMVQPRSQEEHPRSFTIGESEGWYQSLLENTPLVMWRKDLDGIFVWVNDNFCKTLARSQSEIIGKTDFDLFPYDLATRFRAGDNAAIRDGMYEDAYEPYEAVIGKESLYIHVLKKPYHDLLGRIVGTQGAFVTATGDTYRELFDQAPIGFHELDRAGRIRHVNAAERTMLGYSEREMARKRFLNCIDEADRDVAKKLISDKLHNVKQTTMEWHPLNLKTKTGATIPVLMASRSVTDANGLVSGLLCAIRELSAGSEIEDALHETDSYYLARIKDLPLPVFCVGSDLRVSFANEMFVDGFVHRNRVAILGKTGTELYGPQGAKYDRDNQHVLDSEEVLDKLELHRFTAGGEERPVRVLKFPIRDRNGGVIGVQGVFWELADQENAKNALQEALRAARVDASLKSKEALLTMLSHQLRSPVWQAFERVDKLVWDIDPTNLLAKSEADLHTRRLATIRGLIRKTKGVAWGLDMMSKLAESEDIKLKKTTSINPRQLAKIAREAAMDVQLLRRSSNSFTEKMGRRTQVPEFEVVLDDEFGTLRSRIVGDIALIEQAIGNLVENAFKYSMPDSTIHITCSLTFSSAKLCVKNQPLPFLEIDSFARKECRKREWRSKGASATDADGTGLGLWFVDRIMVAHDGELLIQETDGDRWNRFEIQFPLVEPSY